MTHEARIEDTDTGKQPADDGWFILNAAEIGWATVEGGGTWCSFESPEHRNRLLGIGIHYLPPGETPGFYHEEDDQEGFLVLTGECLLIVEGEERRMGPWDYFHCPPGTNHITIGAGENGCAILMVGTRLGEHTHYSADPTAARHGAAVATPTNEAREAYRGRPPIEPARAPWPLPG
jgi:quercetin dioxygenase-like cupin family protein